MSMEKICRERSLPGRLIPAPRSITTDCGIAWSAPASERGVLEAEKGLPEFEGIYEREL